jgi:DNA repair protein RadC
MTATPDDRERYERYERVVTVAVSSDLFALDDVKAACAEEQPALVTRIIHELQRDGHVEPVGPKSKRSFRWRRAREQFSTDRWIASKVLGDRMTLAPKDERPRERLLSYGAATLRTADLLAILVRTGRPGESALQAGEKIAARYGDRLDQLAHAGRGELSAVSSVVRDTAFCQIMAGIELGRRVAAAAADEGRRITNIRSSSDAMAFCCATFARLADDGAQEEFHVVSLNTKNQVLATHQVSLGLLDQTVVHPREVFRPAIKEAAKSVILVHNHPSGDPTPSEKDLALTRRLDEAGTLLGIQVLDHIIVARNGATSIREQEATGA